MTTKKIGFIGGGNMATALIKGIVSKNVVPPENINVFDIDETKLKNLENEFKIITQNSNHNLINDSDIIFLAVKPQSFNGLAAEIENNNFSGKCIVSIMAGIKIEKIKIHFNEAEIIRTMPNTPALVGEGMTGIFFNKISEENKNIVMNIFSAVGNYLVVDNENDINVITAVSGSGPAYLFYIIEAVEKLSVQFNFSDKNLRALILKTFKGAIKLIEDTNETPLSLRKKVTSPNGTTEAATRLFDKKELMLIIQEGIKEAYNRSIELSKD